MMHDPASISPILPPFDDAADGDGERQSAA